jgi:ADP-ribose pyrophosphatase YjhB (NUDIX family)
MLHLIPASLHRLLYRVADKARRQWWRVRPPRRGSVIVVAFDNAGQVLLVRHSYGPPVWAVPGGGLDRDEAPEAAASREIREELGCGLADLIAVDASEQRIAGSRGLQHIFAARLEGTPLPDMREIIAVTFADPEHLPNNCGARTRKWIAKAVEARSEQR